MALTLFTGTANPGLGRAIAEQLHTRLGECSVQDFPDGELQATVAESVRGRDVYVVQPTAPPVERNLFELLLLSDASRRAGAARLTAVLPYCGYARQERRAGGREAVGARVVADLIGTTGFARIVALDLHAGALEGFFSSPLEHLTAVPDLVDAVGTAHPHGVVVAPDLGAVKLAERYARALHLPVAVVLKTRMSGADVRVRGLAGEVRGLVPLIVDDMISTGGTVAAAVDALIAAGSVPDVTVVASHGLFVGPASERLAAPAIRRMWVTDSVAPLGPRPRSLRIVSVAPLLAEAISRLHDDRSLDDLVAHG